jgi:hypothetical protein
MMSTQRLFQVRHCSLGVRLSSKFRDRSFMLIGGQAPTFWTRFLEERSNEMDSIPPIANFEGSARRAPRRAAHGLRRNFSLPSGSRVAIHLD